MNCERAVAALTIRPAAKTPTILGTRISPDVVSTCTSTNCAPNECRAYSRSIALTSSTVLSVTSTGPSDP